MQMFQFKMIVLPISDSQTNLGFSCIPRKCLSQIIYLYELLLSRQFFLKNPSAVFRIIIYQRQRS